MKFYIGLIFLITLNLYSQWSSLTEFPGSARRGSVSFVIGDKAYICTGNDGELLNDLWEYDPSSDSWLRLEDLPGAGRFEAVGMSDGEKGYIVTGQTDDGYVKELWSYSVETGITEALLPETSVLYQNYPNPFNPATQIRFALTKIAEVKLDVYNISGQKVAELANRTLNAGNHAVDFDGSGLNSGLYYFTLEVDGYAITRKMVLTK